MPTPRRDLAIAALSLGTILCGVMRLDLAMHTPAPDEVEPLAEGN